MAPPACDRDYERVYSSLWSPSLHRRCFWMQRMVVVLLLQHCSLRSTGIGLLPLEVLVTHILPKVEVMYT